MCDHDIKNSYIRTIAVDPQDDIYGSYEIMCVKLILRILAHDVSYNELSFMWGKPVTTKKTKVSAWISC